MKNLNIAKLLGFISIFFIISIQQTKAITHLDIGSMTITNDTELLNDIQEALGEYQSTHDIEEVSVEVVDQNFNLIAFGIENCIGKGPFDNLFQINGNPLGLGCL